MAVTRQPPSVSFRLGSASAAPTSRSRRPFPSPSQRRMIEWLECGSGLSTYRVVALLIAPSSNRGTRLGKIRVEPPPARLREEMDAPRRQRAHDRVSGVHRREEE